MIFGVAMTLGVAHGIAIKGIGMMLLTVPVTERHRAAVEAIAKLSADLNNAIPKMMAGVDDAETRSHDQIRRTAP